MEIRVYKENRKPFRDYVDNITVVFPIPKRLQERERSRAFFIAGNFGSDGRWNRLHSGDIPQGVYINGNQCYLGKKMRLDAIPEPARAEIVRVGKIWNEAVGKDTEEAWERWNEC